MSILVWSALVWMGLYSSKQRLAMHNEIFIYVFKHCKIWTCTSLTSQTYLHMYHQILNFWFYFGGMMWKIVVAISVNHYSAELNASAWIVHYFGECGNTRYVQTQILTAFGRWLIKRILWSLNCTFPLSNDWFGTADTVKHGTSNCSRRFIRFLAWFVFRIVRSLCKLTGTSAVLLPMCMSNCKAMWQFKLPISRLYDFTRESVSMSLYGQRDHPTRSPQKTSAFLVGCVA